MRGKISKPTLTINSNGLFLTAWSICLLYYLLFESSEISLLVSTNSLKYIVYGTAEILLFTKMAVFDKYRAKTLIIIASILVVTVLGIGGSSRLSLAIYISFILSGKSINVRLFIKNDMRLRVIVFITLFVLSMSGIIPNYSALINGNMKYAFGWAHPNTVAATLLLILVEKMYIGWNHFKIKNWAVLIIVLLFLSKFSAARGFLYAFLAICIWYIIIHSLYKEKTYSNRIIGIMYSSLYPFFTVISFLLVLIYSSGSMIGTKLNDILTGRLVWSERFLIQYGISIFGQNIDTVSTRQALINQTGSRILDMSYIRIWIEYGLVIAVLFLIAYMYLSWNLYKYRYYPELMVVIYFSIVGITSTSTISFFNNYTLLFLWLIYRVKTEEKAVPTMISSKNRSWK